MKQKNRYNPSMNYTDFIYYLVNILFNFLKDNYYCISVYYIQLGTNMITLLRLLYISALARIEKLPQKNFNLV